jgi:hypothetical protein
MSIVYYILPVALIILVVFISRMGQKRALQGVQSMTPEQARAQINQYFADSFDLEPGESLHATWIGEEYQGQDSATKQVAGAALNQLSRAMVGVSTYVPMVRVGLTTTRRILISREYSDMGERGNYKQIMAFGPGTRAVDAATARPGEDIKPPLKNPLLGQEAPEFVRFVAPNGEHYEAWMIAGQTMSGGFIASFNDVCAQVS